VHSSAVSPACTSHVCSVALQGVRLRLHSGATSEPFTRQGKRVARLFSLLLAPSLQQAATATSTSPTPPETPSPTRSHHPAARSASPPQAPAACDADADAGSGDLDGHMPGDEDLRVEDEQLEVLYDDAYLSLLPEEVWWDRTGTAAAAASAAAARKAASSSAARDDAGPVTGSEDSDASSELSLEALDTEERVRPVDLDKKWRPVQLHTVLADVRQSEEPVKRLQALGSLEQLVRCASDQA
jgi:hypothetical protein